MNDIIGINDLKLKLCLWNCSQGSGTFTDMFELFYSFISYVRHIKENIPII